MNLMPSCKSKSGGCSRPLVIGCSTVLAVLIIVGIIAYFGIKGVMEKLIDEWTDESARTLPEVIISPEEGEELVTKVDAFMEAVKNGDATEPLVLSSDEINALIKYKKGWNSLSDKVHISIVDNKIGGELSIPLSIIPSGELPPPLSGLAEKYSDRYINGSGIFSVALINERLLVFAENLEIKGREIPEKEMKKLQSENLAEEINQDPDFSPFFEKLKSINVSTNKLVIIPSETESINGS